MIDELELGGAHRYHDDRTVDERELVFNAWTAPRTWVTSEVVTSSIMNTHVRDNLLVVKRQHAATVADTTIANTLTETNVHTSTLAAGELGANGWLEVHIAGTITRGTGAGQLTFRLKLGGTTILTSATGFGGGTGTGSPFVVRCYVKNQNAAGTQYAWLEGNGPSFGTAFLGPLRATAAIDTSTSKALDVTWQWDTAAVDRSITVETVQALICPL